MPTVRPRHPNPIHRVAQGLLALAWVPFLAASASAQPTSDNVIVEGQSECRTWLPDFDSRCNRVGRPAGAVMPMSMPYLFEDPYVTTGVNLVGIWHDTPNKSVFRGGKIGVLALQLRLAITEDLAFIATKDGYAWYRPDTTLGDIAGIDKPGQGPKLLNDSSGWYNFTIGFKYQLNSLISALDDWGLIVTPALRYEIPSGNGNLGQGDGDGVIIPSASAAWNQGNFHSIVSLGGQVPFDSDLQAESLFYNLHLDYAFELEAGPVRFLVPFFELNGMHFTKSGDGSRKITLNRELGLGKVTLDQAQALLTDGDPINGVDVINLGSSNIEGENLLTYAFGLRIPFTWGSSLGLSYERAANTGYTDLFKQRFTAMLTHEF